ARHIAAGHGRSGQERYPVPHARLQRQQIRSDIGRHMIVSPGHQLMIRFGRRIMEPVVLALLLGGTVAGQDISAIRSVLTGVFALDYAACMASLETRKADFTKIRQVTTSGYRMLDHAYEGHNLACQVTR